MANVEVNQSSWGHQALSQSFKWLLGGLFLFGLLTSVYSALMTSTDLQDHWVNTKALLSGANIYDETVYNQVSSMATSQYGLPPYDVYPIYPPSCYAMLTPFAMMDWTAAKVSWLILSLILTFLLVKELSDSFFEGKHFAFLLAALVCSIPWRQHILYGQNAIWSLYFFVLAARLSGQNKTFLSGLSLALALFKYSLIGPMCLYFLIYKKVWKNLLICLGLHGLVNLFFALYLHQSFIYLLLAPLKWCAHKSGGGAYDFFGLWSLLIGPPSRMTYIFSAFVLFALVWMMVKKLGSDDGGFLALAAMVSTIIIYHSVNDYIVVLFPVAWILSRERWDKGLVIMAFGVFLIGYLRGHYFHFDWQPSHAFIASDAGTAASVAPARWNFKTLYTASYSIFWFLSIGILGYKLVRPTSVSNR